ncbi:hypothetical protein WR25_08407 [Diploscapter pachys]|uniref:Acid ceramidase n=1 Tax=Diploscapter pachys TaxID=2018661 RepID=A0A2A2KTR9_9BILA|nr:hypothetical protein WR25_08407 [Diploscapter pachys]
MPQMVTCFAIFSLLGLIQAGDPMGIYAAKCLVGEPYVYDPSSSTVPWYTVNLDEDPKTRWKDVARSHGPQIQAALNTVKIMLDGLLGEAIYPMLVSMAGKGLPNIPQPYKDEIYGMSEYSGVPVNEIALLNTFYEIAKGCTSIVAQDSQGKIYHARNQDFGFLFIWNITTHNWMQTTALKDIVIHVNYEKNGQILYKGVTFAGHLGTLTGIRPHGWTISTNARFGSARQNVYDFFFRGITGKSFLIYADRDALDKCATYQEAIDYLSNVQLLASGYFIVGGRQPGEGAIITRAPNATLHIETIDTSKPNGWYVLQTNYDWDENVIYLDDRRGPGNDCMQKLGQENVDHYGLYQVLSSKPNLNKATVYTAVMQVDEPTLKAFIRQCDDPCWFV